ncbi:MAG: alpha-L-glutamate ligase-like protein [Thermoanaerobaculia bacterium]
MLEVRRRLRERGVLGINRRNSAYVRLWNPRRLYPLVDDKLRTKELAIASGMPVPELYAVVTAQHDVRGLRKALADREQFVVKPAHGSGGNGILIIIGRRGELYLKSSGAVMDWAELDHHISNSLSGLYSLGGQRDRVLVEYFVQSEPELEKISYRGVPDIRLIVYRGFPAMAMIRLPTHLSDGKANLHLGAVGVGIDLSKGVTLQGVQGTEVVVLHPDTGNCLEGLEIPHWDQILKLAAECFDMTGLGYLGVDLVLDHQHGPLILELNARPGLAIQIANCAGLHTRLALIDEHADPSDSLEDRIAFSRQHFAA